MPEFVCLSVCKITQKGVHGFGWNVACRQMSGQLSTNKHFKHKPRIWVRQPSCYVRRSTGAGPCATSPGTEDVLRLSEFQWRGHPAGHSQTERPWLWHLRPVRRSQAVCLPPTDDWCCAGSKRWVASSSLLHCTTKYTAYTTSTQTTSIWVSTGIIAMARSPSLYLLSFPSLSLSFSSLRCPLPSPSLSPLHIALPSPFKSVKRSGVAVGAASWAKPWPHITPLGVFWASEVCLVATILVMFVRTKMV